MNPLLVIVTALTVSPPAPKTAPAAPPITLIGYVAEDGQRTCENSEVHWTDLHFTVGLARLVGPLDMRPFDGKIVAIQGRPAPTFRPPVVASRGQCPIPQMRADWIWRKSGMKAVRSPQTGIPFFTPASVRAFDTLKVTRAGDTLTVRYTNKTGTTLPDFGIKTHYEGCFGKPGHYSTAKAFGSLAPNATVTRSFPAHSANDRRAYAAHSIQLLSTSDVVRFDQDLPLHALGAPVRCEPPGRPHAK